MSFLMTDRAQHLRGLLQTLLGVLILTPDALILRLIEANTAVLIFWRGFFQFLAVALFYACVYRRAAPAIVRSIGGVGVIIACLYAGSNILFITSIRLTSVANTLVIVAVSPMIASVLTWMFLKEKVPARTWVAAVAGFAGIAYIFLSEVSGGSMLGNFLAFAAACTLGANFVIIRYVKASSMVPAVGLTGLIIALVVGPVAGSLTVSFSDLLWLLLLGGVITTLSFALITLGPRYLPAPEVNLIMLVETVLGPLWVWMCLGETVSKATWVGGTILVGALVLHSIASLQNGRTEPVLSDSA